MVVSERSFTLALLLSAGAFLSPWKRFLLTWRMSTTKLNSNWDFKWLLRIASLKVFAVQTHFFDIILKLPLMNPAHYLGRSLFCFCNKFSDCHSRSRRCFFLPYSRKHFFHWILVALDTANASWSSLYLRFLLATMMIFLFLQKYLLFDWSKLFLRAFLKSAFRSNW